MRKDTGGFRMLGTMPPAQPPRVLGIVGGTGPESTVDYYQRIFAAWRARHGASSFPRIVINSIDGSALWALIEASDDAAIEGQITRAIGELSAAGAGLAILASNTVHRVFPAVSAKSPIPMISIVSETVRAVTAHGLRRPALLGTKQVMESNLYRAPLEAAGIMPILPHDSERAYLHRMYLDELVFGTVRTETKARVAQLVGELHARDAVDGVILAGTELSMVLDKTTHQLLPVIDSCGVHVEAAVEWLDGGSPREASPGVRRLV